MFACGGVVFPAGNAETPLVGVNSETPLVGVNSVPLKLRPLMVLSINHTTILFCSTITFFLVFYRYE